MAQLDVSYLGLSLKNPFIVSSSGLTDSVEKIKKLEDAGAAAVVLKSLFEEQINVESSTLLENSNYPEAFDYIRNYTKTNSVDSYLNLIESAKSRVRIPVIASINCISASEWTSFARKIEDAGADAIELNVYYLPSRGNPSSDYEKIYSDLAARIKEVISIPVAFKLGNHFTNILFIINQLYNRGVEGVVLFNRFYAPDIDISKMKITVAEVFSSPADIRQTLRWVGIVAGNIEKMDIAASTGIHDSNAAVKMLLAGASVIQVCSALYRQGIDRLNGFISGLEEWMNEHNFHEIGDFQGRMSYKNIPDPSVYERSQFMKYFSSHDQIDI